MGSNESKTPAANNLTKKINSTSANPRRKPKFATLRTFGSLDHNAYPTTSQRISSPRQRSQSTSVAPTQQQQSKQTHNKKMDATPIIDIKVQKSSQLITQERQIIEMYNTTGKKRGLSLIINNIDFEPPRNGADKDGINLNELFTQLNCSPVLEQNLNAQQMTQCLKEFAKKSELHEVDICVIAIMSHGRGKVDTVSEICGIDNRSIKVTDIISHFSEDNCEALKGKPKIFIFQCCRGKHIPEHEQFKSQCYFQKPPGIKQVDEVDGCDDKKTTNFCNMLIAYSTMPGFVSLRNTAMGCFYIREICNVFMAHAHELHVEDMLKKVRQNLKESGVDQLVSYESLSFKDCFFNP